MGCCKSTFLYKLELEPAKKKNTRSRSRSKTDRLRNTGQHYNLVILFFSPAVPPDGAAVQAADQPEAGEGGGGHSPPAGHAARAELQEEQLQVKQLPGGKSLVRYHISHRSSGV